MPDPAPGALASLGWSGRVAALFADGAGPGQEPARVVRVERGHAVVVGPDGADRLVTARPSPAVGDWVGVEGAVLCRVLPRWSEVARKDPDGASLQVLAANVDLVVVAAPADRLGPARVEREVAVAWQSGARPLVALTKADLAAPGAFDDLQRRLAGVDVVATSAATGQGVDDLARALRPDRTAVLLGPSGAGKSALANALLGGGALPTAPVRPTDQRGRHTTTSRQLMALPGGGALIDTPGLRSLGLVAGGGVGLAFPDVEDLAAGCRFSDCGHGAEPGCAVLAAVSTGALDAGRLASFRKLEREASAEARRRDPMLKRAEMSLWKSRMKEARAKARRRRR